MNKSKEKGPPGGPKHRWEDNIKLELQEVRFGIMDCTALAEDRDK